MSNKVSDQQVPFFAPEEVTEEIPGQDLETVTKSVTTFKFGANQFHCTLWKPARDVPKAALFLAHGFGEYISASYESFARFLSARGYFVFGHDHIGHGRSTGERVQASNMNDYILPLVAHVKERKKNLAIPFILSGHSMGGEISILTVLKEPNLFDYVMLNSPSTALNPDMAGPVKIFFGKVISHILPSLEMGEHILDDITRDKEWIKRLEEDQLFWHGRFKVKQSVAMLNGLQEIEAKKSDFSTPVLIQHGAADKICLVKDSQKFYEGIGSKDKGIKIYPDAYHGLFIEFEEVQEEVYKDAFNWLEKRVGK